MPSHTLYARSLANALDDLLTGNASAGTTTTVSLGELVNPDTQASTSRFDGRWLYCVVGANSGAQRTVAKGGYVLAGGTLTPTIGYSVAPIAGNVFDLTTLFPRGAGALESDPSYRTLLNTALGRLNVRREIQVTITTSARISLATWANWISPERVLSIREPSPTGRIMDSSWREPTIIDGSSPVIEFKKPFQQASGVLTLDVISPAYSFINVGGVNWIETTAGLSAEADEALVSVHDMREAGLVEAYRALWARGVSRPSGSYPEMFAAQQADCRRTIPYYDFGAQPEAVPTPAGRAA